MERCCLKYIPHEDIKMFNAGNNAKAWMSFGCRYIPELRQCRFLVWAPNARSVSVAGDFNQWDREACPMENVGGGCWCAFLPEVPDFSAYKYCITDQNGRCVLKSDPFASMGQYGAHSASLVFRPGGFQWSDGAYMRNRTQRDPYRAPLSIYEVHAGSWRMNAGRSPGYRELAVQLADYCTSMGFTHVELMPLTEYPYDGSWGYQVTGYFAPTSRYGTPDDFRFFVDTLHRAGIGVILDWVPAHFPKDENGLAGFDGTPLFECKERRMAEHPEWGTLIFDYGSAPVQSFLLSSACMLCEEFHIDGIRVDAVSSMLYLSYGRKKGEYTPNKLGGETNLDAIAFLKRLNRTVQETYPGVMTIAEESTAFPLVTGKADDGGLGFTFKWDMGLMHDLLEYLSYDPIYRSYHHEKLTFSMVYAFSEHFVNAFSHDEVVHLKKSMIEKMHGSYELKFATLKALYGFQFAHPGKKLNFMGNEIGQFREWSETRELDWSVLNYPMHQGLQRYYRDLNSFYRGHPAMYEDDGSWNGFRWLNVDDREKSSVAVMRMSGGSRVVCTVNFTPVCYEGFQIALPYAGTLREVLNSDDAKYGGTGVTNGGEIQAVKQTMLEGMPYSAYLTLPPMSAVYYTYQPQNKKNGGSIK